MHDLMTRLYVGPYKVPTQTQVLFVQLVTQIIPTPYPAFFQSPHFLVLRQQSYLLYIMNVLWFLEVDVWVVSDIVYRYHKSAGCSAKQGKAVECRVQVTGGGVYLIIFDLVNTMYLADHTVGCKALITNHLLINERNWRESQR